MTPEQRASEIKATHGLSSLHIFDAPDGWRVFGFVLHPKGHQESVDEGKGTTILVALNALDDRLTRVAKAQMDSPTS